MAGQGRDLHNARVGPFARLASHLVDAITRSRSRAALALTVALGVALLSGWWGASIRIDADLKALLPATAPSVRALDELEARMGSTEMFRVAIEHDDPEQRRAMTEALAAEIESWDEALVVYADRDYTPLRDSALYYLDLDQLEELRDELKRRRQAAIAKSVGSGLGGKPIDADAVTVGEDDWDAGFDDEEEEELEAPPAPAVGPAANPPPEGEPKSLAEWMDEAREDLGERAPLSERELDLVWPDRDAEGRLEWLERVSAPFVATSGNVQLVSAELSVPATDVTFAQALGARVDKRVAALAKQGVGKGGRVQVVAAYNVSKEINVVLRDAKRATAVSAALVVLVLVLGFRRLRSLLLVLVPMVVATGLTLAVARMMVDELNALTVFLFAVLFGMGVDFSVHLYALRRHAPDKSWPAIIASHVRPLFSTMATTAGSLSILLLADFKAFREFGSISAAGVLACFLAALFLVPVLDTLLPRDGAELAASRPEEADETPPAVRGPGPLRVIALLAVLGLAAYGAPQLEFEKDLGALTVQPKGDDKIRYGGASARCAKSLVLVGETPEATATVVERLERERDEGLVLDSKAPVPEGGRRPWVAGIYSVDRLLPTDTEAKASVLGDVAEQVDDLLAELDPKDPADDELRTHLEALEKLSQAKPLAVESLPEWARKPFVERDGTAGRVAHLCLRANTKHLDELVAISRRLDTLIGDQPVLRADSRLVFSDLVEAMQRDAKRLPLWALVVILAFISLDLRRPIPAAACFGALALGMGAALGFMGIWPLHLNFFNLVVMPAVIGLSIDASIHLWHARSRSDLRATATASLLAAATTCAGFGGLLIAEHPGLRSIGEVGVTAVALAVAVAFLALYPRKS